MILRVLLGPGLSGLLRSGVQTARVAARVYQTPTQFLGNTFIITFCLVLLKLSTTADEGSGLSRRSSRSQVSGAVPGRPSFVTV